MQRPDWTALRTASARIGASLFFSRAQLVWLTLLMAAGVAYEQAKAPFFPNPWLVNGLPWLMYLMEVPIIVNVHRRLLLGETPAFRLSGLELRYAAITLVVFFLRRALFAAIPIFFDIFGLEYAQLAYTVTEALLLVLIIPLTLLLPATATARKKFGFADAAEAARAHIIFIAGYFFVLALFVGLSRIPLTLPNLLIPLTGTDRAALHLAEIGRGALTGLIFFLYATIGGTILSLVYAAITSPRPRPTLTASRDAGGMVLR